MNKTHRILPGIARGLALAAALAILPMAAHATPVVDGVLDAEYGAPLVTSAKDNLAVAPAQSINDPADENAKTMDVTNVYVTNSPTALYIYVRLPYYDLSKAHGDWSIALHLGGANDGIAVTTATGDPYGIKLTYNYPKNPNAIIKANFKSTAAFGDGVNGWGYINTPNATLDGWLFSGAPYENYFGMGGAIIPHDATSIHSVGTTGGELAFANGDGTGNTGGIEIKVPLSDFAHDGNLTAPVVGDQIWLQYYGSVRNPSNGHDRAAIDSAPFEEGIRHQPDAGTGDPNYGVGIATQQVAYTLVDNPQTFEVSNAFATSDTTVSVQFTDNVGVGADAPGNYALVDTDNGNAAATVTAATPDATNTSQVNLTTTLVPGHHYQVTVTNAKSVGGTDIVAGRNTATFQAPVNNTFTLKDNGALVPPSKPPYLAIFSGGTRLFKLSPVSGQTDTYATTDDVWIVPGAIQYKYVFTDDDPVNPQITDYDTLNAKNRGRDVASPGPNNFTDYTSGTPVAVTFNLVDYQDVIATSGKTPFMTGEVTSPNWVVDPTFPYPNGPAQLTPVAGQPFPTYSVTLTLPTFDPTTYAYKYILIDMTAPSPKDTVDWDTLNGGNRSASIMGAGDPRTQIVNDTVGTAPVTITTDDILKVAGGLAAAPDKNTDAADFNTMDVDQNGVIDVQDAVAFAR